MLQRSQNLKRTGSHFSQLSEFDICSKKRKALPRINLPGGGGNIPKDLNLNIIADAIFEDSDEDKEMVSTIRDDSDKLANIYKYEGNEVMF